LLRRVRKVGYHERPFDCVLPHLPRELILVNECEFGACGVQQYLMYHVIRPSTVLDHAIEYYTTEDITRYFSSLVMNRESVSLNERKLTDNKEHNHEWEHDGVGLVEWVLFYAPPEQGEGDDEAKVEAEHRKNLEDKSQHNISKRRIIMKRRKFCLLSVCDRTRGNTRSRAEITFLSSARRSAPYRIFSVRHLLSESL